ncbi:hypothetical protein [Microbacterium sp. SY138]|uniref:hypothetical protein n=1 Tax=unclassified Microbacterium TaxID=2609290 RepID=UPI00321C265B
MARDLILADPQSARDALVFAERAAQVGDAAVRLQAERGTLAMYAAALAPQGLLDSTPLVLALRVLRADYDLSCDLTVESLAATPDRAALRLPQLAVSRGWASAAVPRDGWAQTGTVGASELQRVARAGNAEVVRALPRTPGMDVVRRVRAQVWGQPAEELANLPRGVAFAAAAFGFIGESTESASVWRVGRWARVSLLRGHLLYRGPVTSGLTAVRRTGAASSR